jgi:competence protein ComEA
MKPMPSVTKILLIVALATALSVSGALAQARATNAPEPAKTAEVGKLVNVNQATVDQLTTINGIGPVMAKRIVEFREKNGPFKKMEDLLAVQGIGEKKLERLRAQISL